MQDLWKPVESGTDSQYDPALHLAVARDAYWDLSLCGFFVSLLQARTLQGMPQDTPCTHRRGGYMRPRLHFDLTTLFEVIVRGST